MSSRIFRLGAILSLAVASAVMLATPAGAGKVDRFTIHEERTFDVEDFCGVDGLTVTIARTIDLRVHVVPHGPDGLDYYLQHGTWKEVLTNGDTSLTSFATVIEKDLRVTDNGDGTVTVLILATGNATLYGEDGKAIARNPGQVLLELVFGPSGAELSRRVVRESTGRSDEFCDAAVPALS